MLFRYRTASSTTWILSTWNVASAAEELNVKFCLFFMNLDLNSHVWLVATLLDSVEVASLLWLHDGVEMLIHCSSLGPILPVFTWRESPRITVSCTPLLAPLSWEWLLWLLSLGAGSCVHDLVLPSFLFFFCAVCVQRVLSALLVHNISFTGADWRLRASSFWARWFCLTGVKY